jgi:hypothetical protein
VYFVLLCHAVPRLCVAGGGVGVAASAAHGFVIHVIYAFMLHG